MILNKPKVKFCGIKDFCDIEAVNTWRPDYVGFVFVKNSKRYIEEEKAVELRRSLHPDIQAVGVFVREDPETIARYVREGIIDIVQLHGGEEEEEIRKLRLLTDRPIIKAFSVETEADLREANASSADYILLDSGKGGTGKVFDWNLIGKMDRPYFLAGGLNITNAGEAVRRLKPYAVDVSSGIETDGKKDRGKMEAFLRAVGR